MWNYEPERNPHYGLAYPPRKPNWGRRTLVAIALLLAAWNLGRSEFTVVEIDDGSAPAVGQYMPPRLFNGRESAPIASVPVGPFGEKRPTLLLHAPFATRRDALRIEWSARGALPYAPPPPIEVRRQGLLPFGCVVVVRWTEGVPAARACVSGPGEGTRVYSDEPYRLRVR